MLVNNMPDSVEMLGLDVGLMRVGIARANTAARMPEPVSIVTTQDSVQTIATIAANNNTALVILGLPLQPDGNEGAQAIQVREYAAKLHKLLPLPQIFVDESYTSQEADTYLRQKGKNSSGNDDIAACIVLERYFAGAAHV